MPNWVPIAGFFALVYMLYLAKALILSQRPTPRGACLRFVPMLAAAVPMTWALDHEWNSINWYPISHWVGTPVAALAVPATSFGIDLWFLSEGRERSKWWVLPELFVAWPAWAVCWAFFSFWILGWGWI